MANNARSFPGMIELSSPVEQEKPIVFIASTDGVKRDGNEIDQNGWVLDSYLLNPVVLWAHDDTEEPVGKATRVWVDGGALKVEVEFADTEDGKEIEKLVRGGFLNCVSVRWLPLEYELTESGGVRFLKQELLEISVVAVPADPSAVAVSRAMVTTEKSERSEKEHHMSDEMKNLVDQVSAAIQNAVAPLKNELDEMKRSLEKPVTDSTRNLAPATIAKAPNALKGREERNNEMAQDTRGLDAARIAVAEAYSQFVRKGMPVADALDHLGYRGLASRYDSSRAAVTGQVEGTLTGGGALVPVQFYQGFVDYLKNNVVIRNAIVPQAQQLQLERESVDIPRVTSGLTFNWVAPEGAPGVNPSAMVFGQLSMRAKTGFAECVISKDLIEDAAVAVEMIVRNELAYAAARGEDVALLDGTGANGQPKGLMLAIDSSNTHALTATATAATVAKDVASIMGILAADKVPDLGSTVLILPRAQQATLMGVAATAGGGENFPFIGMLASPNPQVYGVKCAFVDAVSTACAVVPRFCWFAEKMAGTIEADDKYLDSDGTTHAASPRRQIVLRLWRKFDFALSQSKAGCLITDPQHWDPASS